MDSSHPGTARSALIVHAHPEPTSFSSAQAHVAREALAAQGYEVQTLDLYARGWNPVLDRGGFPPFEGAFKPQREQQNAANSRTLAPDVQSDLDALLHADLLVLSFPVWWFSLPAILKGWIDRVFVMGAVFGGDYGVFDQAALTGKRAIVLATTGGASASFTPGGAFGDIDEFFFHVHRGMFQFVGYDVLEPVITYGPARLDDTERGDALHAVHEAFTAVDQRAHAATLPPTATPNYALSSSSGSS